MKGELCIKDVVETISSVEYQLNGAETLCTIKLKSGFVITESSGCHDMRRYSARLGMQMAYDKAFKKLVDNYIFMLSQVNPDFRANAVLPEESTLVPVWHKAWADHYTGKNYYMPYYDAVLNLIKHISIENGVEEVKYIHDNIHLIKLPEGVTESEMQTRLQHMLARLENK